MIRLSAEHVCDERVLQVYTGSKEQEQTGISDGSPRKASMRSPLAMLHRLAMQLLQRTLVSDLSVRLRRGWNGAGADDLSVVGAEGATRRLTESATGNVLRAAREARVARQMVGSVAERIFPSALLHCRFRQLLCWQCCHVSFKLRCEHARAGL